MKPRKSILLLLVLAPFMILLSGYLSFRYGDHCNLKALDSVSLREGDLVLRRGVSIESYAVVIAETNNSYSHIGMVVMEGGKPFVIHVEPGENGSKDAPVRKETLNSFLGPGKASHFAIYRSYLDQDKLGKVISRAREFYLLKCRFDNAYNMQDDQFLYCTELVFKAYQKGDQQMNSLLDRCETVNILIAKKNILMPGAFMTSNLFYKINSQ